MYTKIHKSKLNRTTSYTFCNITLLGGEKKKKFKKWYALGKYCVNNGCNDSSDANLILQFPFSEKLEREKKKVIRLVHSLYIQIKIQLEKND